MRTRVNRRKVGIVGLAKKFFLQVFHKMLWKNPNELFGQPNTFGFLESLEY